MRTGFAVAVALSLCAADAWAASAEPPPTVRVAAIQCYSRMGEVERNRKLLTGLIEKAAGQGAKIVVLPECAVQGYMDPGRNVTWSAKAKGEGQLAVQEHAESVPGPSTRHFAELAKKLGIYLVVPLIEAAGDEFYNAQVLLGPEGKVLLHHRKWNLWPPGDATWASPGTRPVQVADTPLGRLGLMICYDVHKLPEELKKAGADVVLYSVGWYGPNTETWFGDVFPRRYVVRNGFAAVAANWSAEPGAPGWPGHGYSCVVAPDGKVLAMAKTTRGDEIVLADVPTRSPRRLLEEKALKRYPPNRGPVDVDNLFSRQNPGYKQRAGEFYEKEYLGKAVEQLAEAVGLAEEQLPFAKAILRAYIYEWLDACVRGGGAVAAEHLERALAAMDERCQGELKDDQYPKYLEWRKDRTGARNALAFLMRPLPPPPHLPGINE
ncbi:MAG TPA: carbon-nitrogen hydrolase family protein [Planctomycetota bacterium]|nr:carbon-nitrogen hydrolase family protein [Planctomycetota bacterium]